MGHFTPKPELASNIPRMTVAIPEIATSPSSYPSERLFPIIATTTHRSSQQRCSLKKLLWKISQYSQKTSVLESLFNKVAGLQAKETPNQVFSREYCEIFNCSYFEEYLQTAASVLNRFFKTTSFWRSYFSEQLIKHVYF